MAFFDFLRSDKPESTTRVVIFYTATIFVPVFTYAWYRISREHSQLQDIPNGVLWLLFVLLGIGVTKAGIEVAQNVFGKKPESQP